MKLDEYTFVFDIDGTICPIKKKEEKYEDLVPFTEMVEKIRECKKDGAKIVLFTSRNMNSYGGNIGIINKHTAKILLEWLDKWNIPYDEIIYGKPWPGHKGFYIDDRSVRPDEFLNKSVEELNELCKSSQCNSYSGMKKIDVVITMGGLGSRFKKAGYDVPKYMISAKGKTLFEWSMESLSSLKCDVEQYIFVALKDEKEGVAAFINSHCEKLGIKNCKVIIIDYLTDGQATTAMLAAKFWKQDNSLLIYNIDTYVEAGQIKRDDFKGDGFIPCFKAEGNHWSFVRLDENGKVVEIKEKQRISDNCTIGAYYFKSCSLYEKLYNEYYTSAENLVRGEKYVAPLYDYLLKQNGEIYISDIPAEKVHVLGTPEELNTFLGRDK